jgi:hypothetical protein
MDKQEKEKFLKNLERDLPAMQATLSQLKAEMRGLKGSELDIKGRKALKVQLEVNGMLETIKTLRKELGK